MPGESDTPETEQARASDARGRASRLAARLPIILGAATGVLLCGIALAAVLLLGHRSTPPDAAAQSLCASLQSRDYAATYMSLSTAFRQQGTQEQFVDSQRELDILNGPTHACGYTIVHTDGAVANVQFTITRDISGTRVALARFILEGGVWRLDSYDASVI